MPEASNEHGGAPAPITATFDLSAAANIGEGRHHHTGSIFTSTDGRKPSLVWERSTIGSGWGGGWTGWNVGQSPIAFGGRIERDRTIAANTAHELEFKNSILSAAVDTIITQVMGAHGLILAPRLSPEALEHDPRANRRRATANFAALDSICRESAGVRPIRDKHAWRSLSARRFDLACCPASPS